MKNTGAQQKQHEQLKAALALLLGPETTHAIRVRARQRLTRQDTTVLPLILHALNTYPEITTPIWPGWPPQYAQCSRLVLHFSKRLALPLDQFLTHPCLNQTAGPVLWISVIEATNLLSQHEYEALLHQGLEQPWPTVRYAAALALALRARSTFLQPHTVEILQHHLHEFEAYPVRLSSAHALFNNDNPRGLDLLLELSHAPTPTEIRQGALFVLATELPLMLPTTQRERVISLLLRILQEQNAEIIIHAAHALGALAYPSLIATLRNLLQKPDPRVQVAALTALKELATRQRYRSSMRQQALPAHLLPLLRAEQPEVRRQACFTLAVCGGEFVSAVLGTLVLSAEHPVHIEALESLRLLHGALQPQLRLQVVRWLLSALQEGRETVQITALDSLAHLLWQAHRRKRTQVWSEISGEIIHNRGLLRLLNDRSAWVRQRAIEVFSMLDEQLVQKTDFHERLRQLLFHDHDSGVRACAAFVCGQSGTRQMIPDLIQTLLDSDDYVAETALNALAQLMTPTDSIIEYVVRELAGYGNPRLHSLQHLPQAAHALLRRLQKSSRRMQRNRLRRLK